MKLTVTSGDLPRLAGDLALLPVFESDVKSPKLPPRALVALNQALDGLLLSAAAEERFSGKREQSFLFHTHGRVAPRRVLLLGLGARDHFEPEHLRLALGKGIKAARKAGATVAAAVLPETRELEACLRATVEGMELGAYRFDRYKTADEDERANRSAPREVRILLPPGVGRTTALQRQLKLGASVARATNWARDLVNEPASALTPTRLANLARKLGRTHSLKVEVLGRDRIERLRMGMLLAVARGSAEPPALIHLTYEPRKRTPKAKPLALVGKAITFDSGGLSLKPTDSMLDMKSDMAGAAAVLGAMQAIAELQPPFPVHAFMGACENMPGGRAYKVGDVLTSRLGKTVEVTNTDAEGRLVLGDVLTWAAEHEPSAIIDLATLTGACVVALGNHIAGVFGNDDATVLEVLEAAKTAGEPMWRLPLSDLQRDSLKSEIADLKNAGERWGGAINAALFLKEFVGDTPWVHLDIAGPAFAGKERGYLSKGGTGAGVRTLAELVRRRASL